MGCCLMQEQPKVDMQQAVDSRRQLCRYKSGHWVPVERTYDAGKKECKGWLKVLKKMRFWLYGVRFWVQIDARTLVYQLNLPANDLPGAMVTCWIAWIHLFDFDVVHVPGQQHTAADGLSRRKGTEEDVAETEKEDSQEMEEFLDQQLFDCRVRAEVKASVLTRKYIHSQVRLISGKYAEKWEDITCFLKTLELPECSITDKQRQAFCREATKFLIRDGHLCRR
jgi:hypothetical protein